MEIPPNLCLEHSRTAPYFAEISSLASQNAKYVFLALHPAPQFGENFGKHEHYYSSKMRYLNGIVKVDQ
jgi:hypothetical protein